MSDIQHTATAVTGVDKYKTEIQIGESAFTIVSDASDSEGGGSVGPSPTELATGALASCKTMTAMMYANRKGWALESVRIDVRHVKKAIDGKPRDAFECDVKLKGSLDDEQRRRIYEITSLCPVSKMIEGETPVESTLLD